MKKILIIASLFLFYSCSPYGYRVETKFQDNGTVSFSAYVHSADMWEKFNYLKNIEVNVSLDKADSGRAECIRQADAFIEYCKKYNIK